MQANEPTTATESKPVRKKSKVRWVIAFLMWAAIAINYIDRTVLSAAAPFLTDEFSLSEAQMGIILSGFFWSYALLQIPAGWFADRFGQRRRLASPSSGGRWRRR